MQYTKCSVIIIDNSTGIVISTLIVYTSTQMRASAVYSVLDTGLYMHQCVTLINHQSVNQQVMNQ